MRTGLPPDLGFEESGFTVSYAVADSEHQGRVEVTLPLVTPARQEVGQHDIPALYEGSPVDVVLDDPSFSYIVMARAFDVEGLSWLRLEQRVDRERAAARSVVKHYDEHKRDIVRMAKETPDIYAAIQKEKPEFLEPMQPAATIRAFRRRIRGTREEDDFGPLITPRGLGTTQTAARLAMVWVRLGFEYRDRKWLERPDGLPPLASSDEAVRAVTEILADPAGRREEGRRLRGAERERLLQRAVEEYRREIALEVRAPNIRKAIGDRLGYSAAHIGRLLVQARDAGLLGDAPRGKAGEITEGESS